MRKTKNTAATTTTAATATAATAADANDRTSSGNRCKPGRNLGNFQAEVLAVSLNFTLHEVLLSYGKHFTHRYAQNYKLGHDFHLQNIALLLQLHALTLDFELNPDHLDRYISLIENHPDHCRVLDKFPNGPLLAILLWDNDTFTTTTTRSAVLETAKDRLSKLFSTDKSGQLQFLLTLLPIMYQLGLDRRNSLPCVKRYAESLQPQQSSSFSSSSLSGDNTTNVDLTFRLLDALFEHLSSHSLLYYRAREIQMAHLIHFNSYCIIRRLYHIISQLSCFTYVVKTFLEKKHAGHLMSPSPTMAIRKHFLKLVMKEKVWARREEGDKPTLIPLLCKERNLLIGELGTFCTLGIQNNNVVVNAQKKQAYYFDSTTSPCDLCEETQHNLPELWIEQLKYVTFESLLLQMIDALNKGINNIEDDSTFKSLCEHFDLDHTYPPDGLLVRLKMAHRDLARILHPDRNTNQSEEIQLARTEQYGIMAAKYKSLLRILEDMTDDPSTATAHTSTAHAACLENNSSPSNSTKKKLLQWTALPVERSTPELLAVGEKEPEPESASTAITQHASGLAI